MQQAQLQQRNNSIHVTGFVNFATVMPLRAQGEQCIRDAIAVGQLQFDLSCVECTDSAILPLLTAWLRCSKRHQVNVRFVHFPPVIERIAKVCGLWSLLETFYDE